jgi:hypothetical protein
VGEPHSDGTKRLTPLPLGCPDPIDSAKAIYQRNSLMYSKGQTVQPVRIEFFKRHMYRGLGVSMGRSCAVNAIFFSSFELIKKRLKALDD